MAIPIPGTTLYHQRTQHAVGHGGFHSAMLAVAGKQFHYIYDCGAKSSKRLKEEIDNFAPKPRRIEVLFLSHLDSDHVNGVAKLLAENVSVNVVVLPYLSALERMTLVARGGRHARTSSSFFAQPTKWLRARGVNHIIYLKPNIDQVAPPVDPDPVDSDPRPDPGDGDKNSWQYFWIRGKRRLNLTSPQPITKTFAGGSMFARNGQAIWHWVPFVRTADKNKLKEFDKEVMQAFGQKLTWSRIQQILKDETDLKRLKGVYEKVFGKHANNANSLCLFSGPHPSFKHRIFGSSICPSGNFPCPCHSSDRIRIGWMGTGDYDLKTQISSAAFKQFYQLELPEVQTFMLPHHGSIRSLDPQFLSIYGPRRWVVACPPNSKHHPDPKIFSGACTHGCCIKVTDQPNTQLVEGWHIL